MEMCYDGALVMPSSYAVMDEDEMTYVEGGISLSWSTVIKIGQAIIAVCGAVGTVLGMLNNFLTFGAKINGITEVAFAQAIGKKVAAGAARIASWIGKFAGFMARVISVVLAAAGGYALGYYVSKRIYNCY